MSAIRVAAFFCAALVMSAASGLSQDRIALQSPTAGLVEAVLSLPQEGRPLPELSVSFRGEPVAHIALGVQLADGTRVLSGASLGQAVQSQRHAEYDMPVGKRRFLVEDSQQLMLTFNHGDGVASQVEVRAFDDGLAFRYRFPQSPGQDSIDIAQELTAFRVPVSAKTHPLFLKNYTTSHEGIYQHKNAGELQSSSLIALPLLLEGPFGAAAITEANLTNYAGMYLQGTATDANWATLSGRLSPLPGTPQVSVHAALPHSSPWRVLLLGEDASRLMESDVISHLNEPCALADTSWIRTGKTMFPWWNGYYEENLPFDCDLNTETMKYYIDFCAEHGIPFHSLDGVRSDAWYGGTIVPYQGNDITQGRPGLDLPAVIEHARQKGVKLRLWMHWEAAKAHMHRAFPLYKSWGIHGVMIDFMDRDDQEMVNFCRELVALAAENQLTVTFHGCPKPTGLERTYPNLLTHEGVLNLEYDKWRQAGCTPDHQLTVPFTRMLAGPLDFHQGSFRAVSPAQFTPRNDAPLVIGSAARTLASYVVWQNPLSMVADYPSAYRKRPEETAVLAAIPTTWDETVVISGRVGDHLLLARRSEDDWHLAAINSDKPVRLKIALGLLGKGTYVSERFVESPQARDRVLPITQQVTQDTVWEIELNPASGFYARLSPHD